MKKIIKSNTNIKKYDLYIEVEYTNLTPSVKITSGTSVYNVPNSVYGKWDSFIINIENLFDENGFEIAEQHSSNRQNSLSQYYAIYPANEEKEVVYEIMMVLRVSDHALPRGVSHGKAYYERYAQQNKRPEAKQHQRWKFEQIIVDGQYDDSYDEALKDAENIIEHWSKNTK